MKKFQSVVAKFHRDEVGMESVQIIMILAIAAMVCLGVTKVAGTSTSEGGSGDGLFGGISSTISSILPGVGKIFGK